MNFCDEHMTHKTARDLGVSPGEVYQSLEEPYDFAQAVAGVLASPGVSAMAALGDGVDIAIGLGELIGGDFDEGMQDLSMGSCGLTPAGPLCDVMQVLSNWAD
jgi:hypothetical protein